MNIKMTTVEYNKKNKQLVDDFLDHPKLRRLAEDELGAPIKVVVWWDHGVVKLQGRHGGKVLFIEHILQAANELEAMQSGKLQ